MSFTAPFSGFYTLQETRAQSYSVLHQSGGVATYEEIFSSQASHFSEGQFFTVTYNLFAASYDYVRFELFFPVYEVILDTAISGDTYNINTRPTTITGGNYGIIGDDGNLKIDNSTNQIINETNNTYYNPSTGQTSTITDWSYNYENRTYDITLDTGDKVSVEYGDQNITITENNVTYIIYYVVNGSGSTDPSPTPSACVHDWQARESTAPTCISPGKTLNTCSKCGATTVDITPALGHDWQVWRTVLTKYDEDGNLIQEGYIIYECSRCGEQYKDGDSTGPPDDSTDDGGLLEFLNGIIKSLSDNLSGAVVLLQRFFSEIPKLFGGFLEFLSAMFPYLPDEIIFLFTFGIAALVFIGVINAMRRR